MILEDAMAEDTRTLEKPKRWDIPFSQEEGAGSISAPKMSMDQVEWLIKEIEPFNKMKPANFGKAVPLKGILFNDARIRRYRPGEIIIRQRDYGTSAFLILEGTMDVYIDVPPAALGRSEEKKKGLLNSLVGIFTAPKSPEVRDPQLYKRTQNKPAPVKKTGDTLVIQDIPVELEFEADKYRASNTMGATNEQGVRQWFGELAALGRIPRSATVVAKEECRLLEVRWQGLRDLMKKDGALREQIYENYRNYGLRTLLDQTPFLKHLSPDVREQIQKDAVFETYGAFDWYGTFKSLRKKKEDPLHKEPLIAQQGDVPDGLIILAAGFARLSRSFGSGEQTINYLGKGEVFGLPELTLNAEKPDNPVPYSASLRAVGYVDIVRIPAQTFNKAILKQMAPESISKITKVLKAPQTFTDEAPVETDTIVKPTESKLDTGLLEFLVQERAINGTASMVIDLNRCVRCDDCVRACASGHNNNPRFIRHGKIHDNFMLANACMHCVDPVCMIGCPTGAIHREANSGNILINDMTCIGCGVCAKSCPYDNIRLVEVRDALNDEQLMVSDSDGKEIVKATKCDLCNDHAGGPACQRACPHDALIRADLSNADTLTGRLIR